MKIRFNHRFLYNCVWVSACFSMFTHSAAIQWSSLINAEARSAPITTAHPRTSTHIYTHRHTVRAKWTTIFYGIDCKRGHAQDNIHTLHQAWQILQADGAHDKHREKKLAEEKKKRKVCMSMCLNCTHMCGAAHARALARISDVIPGLFYSEYVSFNQTDNWPFHPH